MFNRRCKTLFTAVEISFHLHSYVLIIISDTLRFSTPEHVSGKSGVAVSEGKCASATTLKCTAADEWAAANMIAIRIARARTLQRFVTCAARLIGYILMKTELPLRTSYMHIFNLYCCIRCT
jgi:hypothetical protein